MTALCVNEKRIIDEFLELTGIDAVSFEERAMADRLKEKMAAIGFTVTEDEAGRAIGGNAGNLYGYLRGEGKGEPVLLSAHMDTVRPGHGKKPQRVGTRIASDKNTVLGADDVSGIVEILEAVRIIRENHLAHRDIEVVFSAAEEVFCKGAAVFDTDMIRSREAYVLDASGHPGTGIIKAPTIIAFTVTVKGREAHAGFEPEKGIHAICVAANALSKIQCGHIEKDTTVNIGTINGGQMRNVVPKECVITGEIRSMVHEKACAQLEIIRSAFQTEAQALGGSIDMEDEICLQAYETDRNEVCVRKFLQMCERLGISPVLTETFGGSDNNIFARNGIPGIVISCGMENVHSTEEYIETEDLVQGALLAAELILRG